MLEASSVWPERVAEWRASGLSARVFCEKRGISAHTLRHWRRRLLDAERRASPTSIQLARVQVAPVRKDIRRPAPGTSSGVTLVIGEVRVALDREFDRPTLEAVLEVVTTGGGWR